VYKIYKIDRDINLKPLLFVRDAVHVKKSIRDDK
jgi:hypothetical protein